MPRPKKCRKVCCMPKYNEFIPAKKSHENDEPIILSVDEYEAIRLIDDENLSQEECSKQMNVARTTIQQIYTIARKKIAKALVNGNRLLIQGGDYVICEGKEKHCHHNSCNRHHCPRNLNENEEEF